MMQGCTHQATVTNIRQQALEDYAHREIAGRLHVRLSRELMNCEREEWLRLAQAARDAGDPHQFYTCTLAAEKIATKLSVRKKLRWATNSLDFACGTMRHRAAFNVPSSATFSDALTAHRHHIYESFGDFGVLGACTVGGTYLAALAGLVAVGVPAWFCGISLDVCREQFSSSRSLDNECRYSRRAFYTLGGLAAVLGAGAVAIPATALQTLASMPGAGLKALGNAVGHGAGKITAERRAQDALVRFKLQMKALDRNPPPVATATDGASELGSVDHDAVGTSTGYRPSQGSLVGAH